MPQHLRCLNGRQCRREACRARGEPELAGSRAPVSVSHGRDRGPYGAGTPDPLPGLGRLTTHTGTRVRQAAAARDRPDRDIKGFTRATCGTPWSNLFSSSTNGEIAAAPREITELMLDLVSSYSANTAGPMAPAVLVSQKRTILIARDAITARVVALELLAAQVAARRGRVTGLGECPPVGGQQRQVPRPSGTHCRGPACHRGNHGPGRAGRRGGASVPRDSAAGHHGGASAGPYGAVNQNSACKLRNSLTLESADGTDLRL